MKKAIGNLVDCRGDRSWFYFSQDAADGQRSEPSPDFDSRRMAQRREQDLRAAAKRVYGEGSNL